MLNLPINKYSMFLHLNIPFNVFFLTHNTVNIYEVHVILDTCIESSQGIWDIHHLEHLPFLCIGNI